IRYAEDVKIVAIAHNDERIINPSSYYEKSINAFEAFTFEFINNMLDIIHECSPLLSLTNFIRDADYRNDVIKNKAVFATPFLSPREKEILIYAFHGYTSKEIAKILLLDNRTIEKYTANAKQKLGARNITHAIKKALDFQIIDRNSL
ncbi:MAG: helix-turn-helix transcriptional regulator, partial [Gammaproteobacteria bacterium]|nr:helix-turn-helix transcriptional regulator [Gammaproteobacteria bacterium]